MSDRERWTVYPLLFLTLGVAMRDKIFNVIDVDSIQCRRVIVTDQSGKQQVAISSNAAGGFVRAYGNQNGLAVDLGNTDQLAGLMFIDSAGVHFNRGSIFVSPGPLREQPPDEPPEIFQPAPPDDAGEPPPDDEPRPAEPADESG